ESFGIGYSSIKLAMSLMMQETPTGLSGALNYATDLFDFTTAKRISGHLRLVLNVLVTDIGQRISDVQLLTAAERQQILVEWNETGKNDGEQRCIHELFEAQVERRPDAVAVVYEEQRLSYRALNELGNQLGRYLQKLGVESEVRVAICMERNMEV